MIIDKPSKPDCLHCGNLPDDILSVIAELIALKADHFRGTVEYRLDGSGRIISSLQRKYTEIKLTIKSMRM